MHALQTEEVGRSLLGDTMLFAHKPAIDGEQGKLGLGQAEGP
jgi:hypothetical protein